MVEPLLKPQGLLGVPGLQPRQRCSKEGWLTNWWQGHARPKNKRPPAVRSHVGSAVLIKRNHIYIFKLYWNNKPPKGLTTLKKTTGESTPVHPHWVDAIGHQMVLSAVNWASFTGLAVWSQLAYLLELSQDILAAPTEQTTHQVTHRELYSFILRNKMFI